MSLEINTPPQVTGYLLLFRNTNWYDGHSDHEIREVLAKVKAWFDRLGETGKVVAAQPLLEDATVISGKGGRNVTDGPFAETKEAVGGYVLLSVDSMEEAVAIAQTNPMHDYGLVTEVRPVASSCPKLYQLQTRLAEAVS